MLRTKTTAAFLLSACAVACGSSDGAGASASSPAPVPASASDAGTTDVEAGGVVDGGGSDAAEGGVGPTPGPIPLPPSGIRMGATVVAGGTEFRVWAPHASQAAVSGDFSNGALVPLTPENNGLFAGTVAGAHA